MLLGNGFDLAHGMRTGYKDFLIHLLRECTNEALDKRVHSSADFKITSRFEYFTNMDFKKAINNPDNWEMLLGYFVSNESLITTGNKEPAREFIAHCLNPILKKAIKSCSTLGWVDIEQIYYDELIRIASSDNTGYDKKLKALNDGLDRVKMHLHTYLNKLHEPSFNNFTNRIFASAFKKSDFLSSSTDLSKLDHILVINFNYTHTPNLYTEGLSANFKVAPSVTTINIHGKLDDVENPLIFGFGDEMDDHYKVLEKKNDNRFLDNIKSFGYFRTDNLRKLSQFLEEGEYQVQIMGHSCGLSDWVMLNRIFEHENSRSIKIFHHRKGDDFTDTNYKELTQNISRHFNKKQRMRDLVVPYKFENFLPQVDA